MRYRVINIYLKYEPIREPIYNAYTNNIKIVCCMTYPGKILKMLSIKRQQIQGIFIQTLFNEASLKLNKMF